MKLAPYLFALHCIALAAVHGESPVIGPIVIEKTAAFIGKSDQKTEVIFLSFRDRLNLGQIQAMGQAQFPGKRVEILGPQHFKKADLHSFSAMLLPATIPGMDDPLKKPTFNLPVACLMELSDCSMRLDNKAVSGEVPDKVIKSAKRVKYNAAGDESVWVKHSPKQGLCALSFNGIGTKHPGPWQFGARPTSYTFDAAVFVVITP